VFRRVSAGKDAHCTRHGAVLVYVVRPDLFHGQYALFGVLRFALMCGHVFRSSHQRRAQEVLGTLALMTAGIGLAIGGRVELDLVVMQSTRILRKRGFPTQPHLSTATNFA
jgi:hypothetical protein